MKRMAMLVAAMMMVTYAIAEQVEISLPDPATVRLDWHAIPGHTYRVMITTNLVDQPWQDAVPGGMVAGSVIGAYTEPPPARSAFFRIQKEDTHPPEIESLIPAADAIAVQSNATISITVTDETGIDTDSIVLTIAQWEEVTLASPYLTYDNGTITFAPPDVLGQAGEMITNILTIADTLGHTLSNHTWTFQLARPAEVDDDFLPLTAPPQGQGVQALAEGVPETRIRTLANVQPIDTKAEYHIVSVTSNTVVFSYQGEPPAIPEGKILVSFDAAHPFYRRATSNLVDESQSQIAVWTVDIALTELVTEGSLSSSAFMSADPSPLGIRAASSDLNLLHVEFGDDLSGTVLFEDGGLKLHLPQASWGFAGSVDVSFDLLLAQLRSLDASAKGTLTLDLSPEAFFNQAVNGGGEFPLVQPVTKLFGGMIGIVPVWVEVIMELNAGYEYSASDSGVVSTRVQAEKDLTFYVKLRQNQWTHNVHNPPIVLESDPIYWQLEGTANAKVYVQPTLTVLVYSLAGLRADIKPYAEFDGQYQLNPIAYDLGLYLGMSSTLGIESRVWYSAWGNKPEWELFDLKWPLWTESYPTTLAPAFLASFPNREVVTGNAVTLSANASGNPNPNYKWYFNGERIVGETGGEYNIRAVNSAHSGTYSVTAFNSAGSIQTSCYVNVLSSPHPVAVWVLHNEDPDYSNPPFGDTLTAFTSSGAIKWQKEGFNLSETIGGTRALVSAYDGESVIVCENVANRISKYDHHGNQVFAINRAVRAADVLPDGIIYALTGDKLLRISPQGSVMGEASIGGFDLVCDPESQRIYVVGSNIKCATFSLEQEWVINPIGWSAVSVDLRNDGAIWVAERRHSQLAGSMNRLLHISASGSIEQTIALTYAPYCVRVDRRNNDFYVVSDRLYKYSSSGNLLFDVSIGSDAGWNLAIDDSTGNIWVATRSEVRKYTPAGTHIDTFNAFSRKAQMYVTVPR